MERGKVHRALVIGCVEIRGSVTFFIDQEALLHLLLILKIQYRLSYRALEEFSKSVLPLMDPSVTLSTYSLKGLPIALLPNLYCRRPKVVLIDASGVKA